MPAYKRSGLLPCYAGAMGLLVAAMLIATPAMLRAAGTPSSRERLSLNADWRFIKGEPAGSEGKLSYETLKPWLLATGPEFSLNAPPPPKPDGNPGSDVAYTQPAFGVSERMIVYVANSQAGWQQWFLLWRMTLPSLCDDERSSRLARAPFGPAGNFAGHPRNQSCRCRKPNLEAAAPGDSAVPTSGT